MRLPTTAVADDLESPESSERASTRHRAWTKLVRFCDACARVVTPGVSGRRRRDEAQEEAVKHGGHL